MLTLCIMPLAIGGCAICSTGAFPPLQLVMTTTELSAAAPPEPGFISMALFCFISAFFISAPYLSPESMPMAFAGSAALFMFSPDIPGDIWLPGMLLLPPP